MRKLTFLIAGLATSSPARCATLQIFHPAPGRDAFIVTHAASIPPHGTWSARLLADFSDDLLLLEDGSRVVDSRFGLHAMGTVAVAGLLDVGVVVPSAPAQSGDDEGGSLGDVRLTPKLRLLGGEAGGFTFRTAFVGEASFPSGDEDKANGEPGPTAVPRLVLEVRGERWAGALNVGYRLRESSRVVDGMEVDDEIVLSLGGRVAVGLGFEAVVDAYAFLGTAVDAGFGEVASPAEVLGAVRYAGLPGWLSLQVGGGMGVTGGYGAADARVLASVSFEPPPTRARPPPVAKPPPPPEPEEEEVEWEWELE